MVREPIVLDSETMDIIVDIFDALAEGYHINCVPQEEREWYAEQRDYITNNRLERQNRDSS